MSVDIETSAWSMSESLNSLKTTPSPMHRVYLEIPNIKVWYKVMHEARGLYGKNWRGQSRVRRRLQPDLWGIQNPVCVWFDVPDENFGTWVAIKCGVTSVSKPGK